MIICPRQFQIGNGGLLQRMIKRLSMFNFLSYSRQHEPSGPEGDAVPVCVGGSGSLSGRSA
jgi:hypothetical protein